MSHLQGVYREGKEATENEKGTTEKEYGILIHPILLLHSIVLPWFRLNEGHFKKNDILTLDIILL